ncbi:MAG: Putative sodium:solute symport protein [Proteiniphilum acetatigenes]|jgi:SSS family solute:Na+ symporter|uniref:Putative sodium:solute symport protein n=1 Tax=Proteiniphilum acetatigenes TaxID=294710 RepID=A0A101HGL5_9BACT|nr:MAG: Putative sodium:solute symport protein [Proteiniphilum acetatigenes]MBZ4651728.1 sodium:solute symporter [Proteiniphilum sp.]MDK2852338.1 solute:Na+ symporter, family [Proteiniphilum sp.]
MHIIDILIFIVYMLVVLGIGIYFLRKNKNADDYYVGGRSMSSPVIGLSVVATDVGGGFSIGLGGLGFLMGLSGSWMLFTGLIGAWLSAVFLIPKASKLSKRLKLYTFPQLFEFFYSPRVALLAGIISAIGYIGFTSSQLLAGAKLASATFEGLNMNTALIFMGVIAVTYTAMGGLKAVIYTDVVQWIILLAGLILIGIPLGYQTIGGMEAIRATLPAEFLKLNNIGWSTILNWAVTIIPIWFVGMTLYQRIYASRSPKEAQKAWYIAGAFEWPVMAFMGVILGLFARVAFEQDLFASMGFPSGEMIDAEMGLPLLLRAILPVGLMGLMMAAYFSAVMSTADSCIMAASGNIESDILKKIKPLPKSKRGRLIQSQLITLAIGLLGLLIALRMENVLELMLHSYAFMVSGLFVPVLGAFFTKRGSATAAFWSMISGGATTLTLTLLSVKLPFGLDPNIFGITVAALCYLILSILFPGRKNVID